MQDLMHVGLAQAADQLQGVMGQYHHKEALALLLILCIGLIATPDSMVVGR